MLGGPIESSSCHLFSTVHGQNVGHRWRWFVQVHMRWPARRLTIQRKGKVFFMLRPGHELLRRRTFVPCRPRARFSSSSTIDVMGYIHTQVTGRKHTELQQSPKKVSSFGLAFAMTTSTRMHVFVLAQRHRFLDVQTLSRGAKKLRNMTRLGSYTPSRSCYS